MLDGLLDAFEPAAVSAIHHNAKTKAQNTKAQNTKAQTTKTRSGADGEDSED